MATFAFLSFGLEMRIFKSSPLPLYQFSVTVLRLLLSANENEFAA